MIDIDTLLAWGAVYKKVNAGEIIFGEGNKCNFYHQLIEGKIKWVNVREDGREFIQDLIEPGECFGEQPLFDEEPYAASAMAEKDSIIIRLHKNSFKQLMKEHVELHDDFLKILSQRLRYKILFVKELVNHAPEKCIINLLNHFKLTHKNVCKKCNKLLLTRQQIADMTGYRVETVIRTMKEMQQHGQLRISGGKVYL
ncbi:MAG: Crp/Fnr family transcriptional regulator [Bacteroidetes bacterium]|nr:Crp/Fnr family transcriptional regulator [Bacteroidota bacterium]MBS1757273.1 Crp/Fnr family transcriptional regulator [Bacteroidota bacterium]